MSAPILLYRCPACGQLSDSSDILISIESDWLDNMHDRPATLARYMVIGCPRCRCELGDDCLVALCEAGCGAVAATGDDFCAGCRAAYDARELAEAGIEVDA